MKKPKAVKAWALLAEDGTYYLQTGLTKLEIEEQRISVGDRLIRVLITPIERKKK